MKKEKSNFLYLFGFFLGIFISPFLIFSDIFRSIILPFMKRGCWEGFAYFLFFELFLLIPFRFICGIFYLIYFISYKTFDYGIREIFPYLSEKFNKEDGTFFGKKTYSFSQEDLMN